jgi:DNA polymerase-3 subunit gamma/tau
VQEIDGASYNGVDEVRRLQEGMSFRPARDRFKIYIVDEVHMLSTAAWNAFLKTLEEPPPHVKFIFATTEVHKVPVTILSRCQRYDFKLIPTQTIARRLEQVLAAESIEADAGAVQVLAREAAGSMRDAMSVLDQVIAFSGTKISTDDVTRVLGVADRKILHDLATALVSGDAAACVSFVEGVTQQGFDLGHVAKDVLFHLRGLVVAKVCSADSSQQRPLRDLLDMADEEVADVVQLAARADTDDLSRLFQGFSRAFDEIVRSGQPRMALEMALVRLARRPPLLALDELLARVGDLERRLGAPPTAPAPPRGGGSGGSARGTHGPSATMASSAPMSDPVSVSVSVPLPPTRTHGALALVETPVAAVAPAEAPRAVVAMPVPRAVPAPPPPPAVARSQVPAPGFAPPNAAPVASPAASPAAPTAPLPPSSPPDLDAWRAIVDGVRQARPPLASVLEHAMPLRVEREALVLGFEASAAFLCARASEAEALDTLTRAARAHFGASTRVEIDASARSVPGTKTLASIAAEQRSAELAKARAAIEGHPVVRAAIRLFDAQLRDVRLPGTDG